MKASQYKEEESLFLSPHTEVYGCTCIYIHMRLTFSRWLVFGVGNTLVPVHSSLYIYIYICARVCVCMCMETSYMGTSPE